MTDQTLPRLPTLQEGERIDWDRLLLDIQRSTWLADSSQRMSLEAIALACGRSYSWAWALKNLQSEPRFHDALMLIGLWVEKTGGTELPLYRDFNRGGG